MKKLTLLLTFLSVTAVAFAQLEVGVAGGFSTTWLLNNNVSDQGPNLNPNASFGGNFGLTGSFFFTENIGVGAELNYNSVNQKYDGEVDVQVGEVNFDAKDHLNYFQVPIMLKVKTTSGFYFEVGPEFNFLSSANGDLTSDPSDDNFEYAGRDIKTGLENVMGIVFGFGGRFPVTDHIVLSAGLRFFGGLSDATSQLEETEFYNELAEGHLGVAETFAHLDQSGDYHYEKTTLATGGIQIGLLYAIGKDQKED